jgi:hypothetical protein
MSAQATVLNTGELDWIWKETVVVYFKVLSSAWKEWSKPWETTVRIASLKAEIWTWDLLSANHSTMIIGIRLGS